MTASRPPHLAAVRPTWAIESSRVDLEGSGFAVAAELPPAVTIGDRAAQVVLASSARLGIVVPAGVGGGRRPVRVAGISGETAFIDVGEPCATGLHQVDNPVFDREGNLYVTYSGARGQRVSVSVFRVGRDGRREPFVSGLVNATSMVFGPDGVLHVSSRFEGTVYRIQADGTAEPFVTELGVACGLAFDADGTLFVGDRSGTVFRVAPDGQATPFAALPPSVAAYHLAVGPDRALYVDRAHAGFVTTRLPRRLRTARWQSCRRASAGRRGSRSTARGVSMSSRRWPGRAGCTASGSTAAGNSCSPGRGWSAWLSTRPEGWSSRPTRPPTASMSRRAPSRSGDVESGSPSGAPSRCGRRRIRRTPRRGPTTASA